MDVKRLKKMCEFILSSTYGNLKIEDFRLMYKHKFDDEKNEWVNDTPAIYIEVKRITVSNEGESNTNYEYKDLKGVESFLESVMGFEFCVDCY